MLAVNETERQTALAQALSDIIWNAGEENQTATVLIPPEDNGSKPIGASQVRLNDMTEDVSDDPIGLFCEISLNTISVLHNMMITLVQVKVNYLYP